MASKDEQLVITKYDLLYEQRMTRVETSMENLTRTMVELQKDLKSDFRWLLGLMIGGYGSLLMLMAHGFKWF